MGVGVTAPLDLMFLLAACHLPHGLGEHALYIAGTFAGTIVLYLLHTFIKATLHIQAISCGLMAHGRPLYYSFVLYVPTLH